MAELKLPHLGEGIDSATVIGIIAKVGAEINVDDPVIEIETDKAVVPVPSTLKGLVEKVVVKDGDSIKPGDTILTLSAEGISKAKEAVEEKKPLGVPQNEAKPVTVGASNSVVEFRLPDLGEGIEGGTVIGIILKTGDSVKKDDPVLELETDKAVIPVPSPCDGTIKEIKVKDGQNVKVGEHLFSVDALTTEYSSPSQEFGKPATEEKKSVATPVSIPTMSSETAPAMTASPSKDFAAGPATRKLARELGVDLSFVGGSAKGGRISIDDLKAYVKSSLQSGGHGRLSASSANLPSLPNFANFGPIRKEKISKLRKTVSERMTSYWTIPHVHQFNEIDVTGIIDLQSKYAKEFKELGSSLSLTQFVIKAMVETIKLFPAFNASFDHTTDELILKDYYNIGVAVDTPSGLIVPVLKGVDKMSVFDIGKNLKDLAAKTRDRRVSVEDLQGAGITLSNLGGIGGTMFTPIINYPETAIIGASKSVIKPVFTDGEFKPRHVMTLCVAYDHRVIDGADGARFIKSLSDYLENIEKSLML